LFSCTLFGIYLVGFQGQTCSHLCFLHCFSYISLAHMDAHFSINKVLPPTWLRRIKNRNSYRPLLHLLAKCASQPPSYLRSIIHIEYIVPHSHYEQNKLTEENTAMISRSRNQPLPRWAIAAHTRSRVKETKDNEKNPPVEKRKNLYWPHTRSAVFCPRCCSFVRSPLCSCNCCLLHFHQTLRYLPSVTNPCPLAPPV